MQWQRRERYDLELKILKARTDGDAAAVAALERQRSILNETESLRSQGFGKEESEKMATERVDAELAARAAAVPAAKPLETPTSTPPAARSRGIVSSDTGTNALLVVQQQALSELRGIRKAVSNPKETTRSAAVLA